MAWGEPLANGPPFPRSPELTAVPRPGLVQQLLSNSAARPTYLGRGGEGRPITNPAAQATSPIKLEPAGGIQEPVFTKQTTTRDPDAQLNLRTGDLMECPPATRSSHTNANHDRSSLKPRIKVPNAFCETSVTLRQSGRGQGCISVRLPESPTTLSAKIV